MKYLNFPISLLNRPHLNQPFSEVKKSILLDILNFALFNKSKSIVFRDYDNSKHRKMEALNYFLVM